MNGSGTRVLFLGETWTEKTGPYETVFRYQKKVLESWGFALEAVDLHKNFVPGFGPTIWTIPWKIRRLFADRFNQAMVRRQILSAVRRFDPHIVLVAKGENVSPQTIREISRPGRVTYNWNQDNPFFHRYTSWDLLDSLPLYSACGTFSSALIETHYTLGCQRVQHIPNWFEPDRFKEISSQTAGAGFDASYDIVFCGMLYEERQPLLRQLVQALPNAKIGIWTSTKLPASDPLSKHVRNQYLTEEQLGILIRRSKIVINVLQTQCRYANNQRVFEGSGLGAVVLTEYSKEIAETLFTEGQEIVCFKNPAEMVDKARWLLQNEAECRKIAEAGKRRTWSAHLLEHRMRDMLTLCQAIRGEEARAT